MYEGGWKAGAKHGLGTYTWPNGATYSGEWQAGCMHGVGTFESPDGTTYQGGWAKDLKQGLGRKVYANGDVYSGLWVAGKCDGPGRYRWRNSNEYNGEWRGGCMHGQGTLRWNTGDRYDGEFCEGEEDGVGIFTWADGSTYESFWRGGRRHGLGVYRPPPPPESRRASAPPERHASPSPAVELVPQPERGSGGEGGGQRGGDTDAPQPTPSLSPAGSLAHMAAGEAGGGEAGSRAGAHSGGGPAERGDRGERGDRVWVREYEDGRLLREDELGAEELEAAFGPLSSRVSRHSRRRRRAANRQGETIYKGHRSYDLMLSLQLGMRHSVGDVAAAANPQRLTPEHFAEKIALNFPRDGSAATPPHPGTDFLWKDYCPRAFRQLRRTFSIDAAQYLQSICGDQALRELPSPGKSGSVFFLSHDDKYIIKTVRKGEVKLLLELLPRYTAHVLKHPHTLLIKFFGLYRVTPANGAKVRFVVMNNLFPTSLPVQRQYDLKGSTLGRTAAGRGAVLKDLDLDLTIRLEDGWHDKLFAQLAADCALLEELRVMDYSLLLGVHSRSAEGYTSAELVTDREDDECDGGDKPLAAAAGGVWAPIGRPSVEAGVRLRRSSTEGPGAASPARSPVRGTSAIGDLDAAWARVQAARAAEAEAVRERIAAALGTRVSDRKLGDLMRLAYFQMLGREARAWRSPTAILARRPLREGRPGGGVMAGTDALSHQLGLARVRLGMNMAATALPVGEADAGAPPEDVVVYFGIIDVLQEYNMSKRLEHGFKALLADARTISAVDPRQYSRRFQEFMRSVFV
ncbi:hypothetical protein WJX81_002291 [Elliptochloris bilobata]|uniref:1-phosphatidylinositol-4-phosphate 5-kinase n=1 Tax=Elliptochloris bilobata TaxID=381761 RepID=A0AAW1SIW8_9CHLO